MANNRRDPNKVIMGGYFPRETKQDFVHIATALNLTETDLLREAIETVITANKSLLNKPRKHYLDQQMKKLLSGDGQSEDFPWLRALMSRKKKS